MADRNVYGNSHSLNGWPMVDQGSCVWVKVPGTNPTVSLQIREGQPAKILGAFAADFNAYVEPLRDADSACWTPTNSVSTSNHLSATALDLNWSSHPFRVNYAGFDAAKIATMRELLAWYEEMVWWGQDWTTPKDAMHLEMHDDTYGSANFERVESFISRKIRADGFSTFRRGGTVTPPPPASGLTAQTLSQAMGGSVSMDRYTALLPAVRAALAQSGCAGNLNRLAMWLGQIGHESGGLKYMEEIASGAAYEGRADLGNTQPGDGVRFKGHGPIQITGRANHAAVSKWAFGKGYVPTPTYFVDNPAALASDQYGFLGAVWYWTVARSNINAMCDAGDIVGVTKAINGGTNGLQDRTDRWNRCRSMGLAALDVTGTPPTQGENDDMSAEAERQIGVIYQELTKKFPSRSPLRHLGEGLVDTATGFVLNTDGSQHVAICKLLAGYGHPPTIALLEEVANADPNLYPDRQDDAAMAQAILADVTSTPAPQVVTNTVAAAAPVAPDTRELDAAYASNASLQQENARLRAENAQLQAATPAASSLPAVVDQKTLGGRIGQFVDSVDGLGLADASDIKERATIAATIAVLGTKNGSQLQ